MPEEDAMHEAIEYQQFLQQLADAEMIVMEVTALEYATLAEVRKAVFERYAGDLHYSRGSVLLALQRLEAAYGEESGGQ